MVRANSQRSAFDKRISTINKGGANTMGEVHIGPRDETAALKGKGKHKNTVRIKKKKPKKVDTQQGSVLAILPLAAFFGGLSMFVGQAMDFQFYKPGGLFQMEIPAMVPEAFWPYLPFVFGGILALLFAWTFRFTSVLKFGAIAAGFWATFQYHTTLVATLPGMYAGFFSKEYVEGVFAAL